MEELDSNFSILAPQPLSMRNGRDKRAQRMTQSGLQEIFEQHRQQLLRYLRAHGAGEEAEDLLQELWIKLSSAPSGPIGAPRNYLFRAATNLMIDRRRSENQAQRRDVEWTRLTDRLPESPANDPGPDRTVDGQRQLALVERELARLPSRAVAVFRLHRIDGQTQRQIASSMGVSSSTIESDLRLVYRLLDELRRRLDEE
ncbi:RNA polymerase sigma factor [Sphingomonas alba]|uniref:RNA polymerase sigma factor n=1 Tax=Sphingomonas alba TaxID=2908208 RepID=A0ABT0RK77_9SPHN|nr:RNA polymerase sigma factor [Sphingomonas alba]MCL6683043.1 RNA polymerase sigma factor [Sphingomonas alba]